MIKEFYLYQLNLSKDNQDKGFQVFLCITNSSIEHQSFIYTQLNDQTVLFQATQFCISYSFALTLNVKQFNLNHK